MIQVESAVSATATATISFYSLTSFPPLLVPPSRCVDGALELTRSAQILSSLDSSLFNRDMVVKHLKRHGQGFYL